MEFYSLLDRYGHVVYENKKVPRKIFFRVMKKFRSKICDTFFENHNFRGLVDFQKKCQKISIEIFSSLEKIFSDKLFFKTFLFS